MRVVGCGNDLVDVKRFRSFYGDGDTELLSRVFAVEELANAHALPDSMVYLAICLAAKEAVLKTIGGIEQGIAFSDIVILDAASARPSVRLDLRSRAAADELGIDSFSLTTAYAAGHASALVIACSRSNGE